MQVHVFDTQGGQTDMSEFGAKKKRFIVGPNQENSWLLLKNPWTNMVNFSKVRSGFECMALLPFQLPGLVHVISKVISWGSRIWQGPRSQKSQSWENRKNKKQSKGNILCQGIETGKDMEFSGKGRGQFVLICVRVCVCVCVCRGYRGEEGLVWVGRWGPLLKGLMYLSTFNS